jgi:putative ABC transport system permease protein
MLEGLDRDIQDHIERETRDNIDRGMTPNEARHAAHRKFGNVTRVQEDTRAVWSVVWLEQLLQDLRYAARVLRHNPGFTVVVVLTLALGIGMNTAVFSVINAALLRPLSYPDAERLVWLTDYDYKWEHRDNYVSRPAYLHWREHAGSFEGMTGYANQDLAVIADGHATQERIALISGEFWNITGGQASTGRLFTPGETHAMVISDAFFRRRFGGDSQVIGKTVSVNGYVYTITGVLAETFQFGFPLQFVPGDEVRPVDAYVSFPDAVMRLPELSIRPWEEATRHLGPSPYHVRVVAKLKPDVAMEQARAEMETVYGRAAQNYPDYKRNHVRLNFARLKDKLAGESKRALIVLLAAAGFVLLIACANIANLLLARASARRREILIRSAVGAGPGRVVRQLLTESVVLALLGGAAGLALAKSGIDVIAGIAPQAIPRLEDARIDGPVLVFALLMSVMTGVLFGLGPALSMWKGNEGRLRMRGFLVSAEVALVIVLLTGAGLMLKSFWRMNSHPSGFTPEAILVMRVPLSGSNYGVWLQKAAYVQQLFDRMTIVPGVQATGVDCGTLNASVTVQGSDRATSTKPLFAAVRAVSPGYLQAMGVRLLQGNWPKQGDLFGVVVNESFARGIKDPIGKSVGGSVLNDVIVGVVANFRYRRLDAEAMPEVYMSYERFPFTRSVQVVIRTEGDPRPVAPTILKTIGDIDRTQPVYEFQTLEQALSDSIAPRRFNLFLLATFAATALAMALVGAYGIIAYSVARRRHEIGIRMALGAQRGEIVGMVVRQGMTVALTGIGVGVAAALGLTRLMASLLYDVQPNDPQIFAAVAVMLAVTTLIASWAPARKAARVDPLIALRYE